MSTHKMFGIRMLLIKIIHIMISLLDAEVRILKNLMP
jgi:hypothetical protein